MILVEPRVFESMQQQHQQPSNSQGWDATSSNLREKDKSIQDILESDRNVYDKANAYQQALWGFLNRFEQYKDRPLGRVQLTQDAKPKTSTSKGVSKEEEEEEEEEARFVENSVERDVVASAPRSMKIKASRLLQRLKSDPDVKWNDRGEFEYRGQLIKNSNLTDLVNDVLRDRKRKTEPRGWETFAEVLHRLNVPQDLIGNPARWSFIKTKVATPDTVGPATKKRKVFGPRKKKLRKNTDDDDDDIDDERFSTPTIETPKKISKKQMRRVQKWNQLFS